MPSQEHLQYDAKGRVVFPYAECREDACGRSEDCALFVDHPGPCEPTGSLVGAIVESLRIKRLRPRSCQCGYTARQGMSFAREDVVTTPDQIHRLERCITITEGKPVEDAPPAAPPELPASAAEPSTEPEPPAG